MRLATGDQQCGAGVRHVGRELANEAALADTWFTDNAGHGHRTELESSCQPSQLVLATDQLAPVTSHHEVACQDGFEPACLNRFIGSLDRDEFDGTEARSSLDQCRGRGCAQDCARVRRGFHPLRQSDAQPDRRVTAWAGTDFTDHHITRIQPYPQLQIEPSR